MTNKTANLDFATPAGDLEALARQLAIYVPDPAYEHDPAAMVVIEEAIAAGREGNIAVGGCIMKHGDIVYRGHNQATHPHHRTDLHAEMVLLNQMEEDQAGNPTPRMRDYVMFSSQEPCPMCAARMCFNQIGTTYYIYRDEGSPESGDTTSFDSLPPGFRGLGERLVIAEARCAPELKELSRQIWLTSIAPNIQAFLDRY